MKKTLMLMTLACAMPFVGGASKKETDHEFVVNVGGVSETADASRVERELSCALRAVVAWWDEHGNGFADYPMRKPGNSWKEMRSSESVREFEEQEGGKKFRWYASWGKGTKWRWQVFFYCNASYTFTWAVETSGEEMRIVEVVISSPSPNWVENP